MHDVIIWFTVTGAFFMAMALAGSFVARVPLTPSVLYVGAGVLGPYVSGFLSVNPVDQAGVLERLSEIAVIVLLFTAGLKLRAPLTNPRWWLALRLAVVSMVITVGLVATAVVVALDAPWAWVLSSAPSSRRPTPCLRPTCRSNTPSTRTACDSPSLPKPA